MENNNNDNNFDPNKKDSLLSERGKFNPELKQNNEAQGPSNQDAHEQSVPPFSQQPTGTYDNTQQQYNQQPYQQQSYQQPYSQQPYHEQNYNQAPYNPPMFTPIPPTGEYPNGALKHSGLGITSFVMGILAVLAGIIGLITLLAGFGSLMTDSYYFENLSNEELGNLILTDGDLMGSGIALIMGVILMFGAAFLGLLGTIFGIIGVVQKDRKKVFGVIGLVMSGLIFGGFILLMIIGSIAS